VAHTPSNTDSAPAPVASRASGSGSIRTPVEVSTWVAKRAFGGRRPAAPSSAAATASSAGTSPGSAPTISTSAPKRRSISAIRSEK
jgi:hypothetical protein